MNRLTITQNKYFIYLMGILVLSHISTFASSYAWDSSIPIRSVSYHNFSAIVTFEEEIAEINVDSDFGITLVLIISEDKATKEIILYQILEESIEHLYGLGDPGTLKLGFDAGTEGINYMPWDLYSLKFMFLEISPYLDVDEMSVSAFAFLSDQTLNEIADEIGIKLQLYEGKFTIGSPIEEPPDDDSTDDDSTDDDSTDDDSTDDDGTDDDTTDDDSTDDDSTDDFLESIPGYDVYLIFCLISVSIIMIYKKKSTNH